MNKTIVLAIYSALLLSCFPLTFATTFSCTHPEICRMARIVLRENHINNIVLEDMVLPSGDPHEFEPSVQDIKKLLHATNLLVGPLELNPWMKNIAGLRIQEKNKIKNKKQLTYQLTLPNFAISIYPSTEMEALGHFWLYPQIYCHLKSTLATILVSKKTLLCQSENIETKLASELKRIKSPIVLTHDALLPLLKKLTANSNQIMALKGSTHHGEVPAKAIKKVYDALKAPKIIWILEDNIATSENIKNKIRSTDTIIRIDTAKSPDANSDFSLLETFHKKLQEIKE